MFVLHGSIIDAKLCDHGDAGIFQHTKEQGNIPIPVRETVGVIATIKHPTQLFLLEQA